MMATLKNFLIIHSYIELTKPRILTLVLVTTFIGFFLGGQGIHSWSLLITTILGAALVCAGASTLNHYLERDVDCLMLRTQNRPIPLGIISPVNALNFGIILILLGISILWSQVNLLTAFLSLLTAFMYVVIYTPLKRISWLNTIIGAIPGAIPPMGGWTAATNQLDFGAWVLFAILFVWQHPHFFAIAWMCKDDYKRGGFKMLPVVEPDGAKTFLLIKLFSIILIPVSLMPFFIGMAGKIYLYGALLAGIFLLAVGMSLAISKSSQDAHRMLKATVYYLPVLLFLIVLDVSF